MSELYIPDGCLTLDKTTVSQVRIGIQGFPGTGKTWAALTFPNPIVANSDKGLGAHIGRKDVVDVPFWNPDYCKKIYANYKGPQDIKTVMLLWVEKHACKLTPEQTLVWDGGTETEAAYHAWYNDNIVYENGTENKFARWNQKLDFFNDLHIAFNGLKCNLIWLMHETDQRDKVKPGDAVSYSGKIRPLLTGQFCDKIVGKYTDWFRQHAETKPSTDEKITDKMLKDFGYTDKKAFKERIAQFPRDTMYYWQLDSDSYFDGKCSSLVNFPKYIFADYKDFCRYRRISQC